MRFDVTVPPGEVVSSATLRLFVTSTSSAGIFVNQLGSNVWGETTATYNNAPAVGAQVASSGAMTANTYVSLNVTSLVRRWHERHGASGLGLEALDIASIEGRNRFPDVRVTEASGFWSENRRTHEALRNTPGAYTYGGAVGHQMQFRALQAILDGNVRAYQVYGPPSDGDAGADWRQAAADADEAIRTMFGKAPELRPAWAFDAALANFLELVHYLDAAKFETKYHLRTFEDSVLSKWLADRGLGREHKKELADLDRAERERIYDEILPRLFPGDTPDAAKRRKVHRLALEISVAQRLQH
jgi:hypothetical protein